MKEMETPTNFCPSRFLKCVQIYIFCQMIQIANLDVQIFVSVFRFEFLIFCDRKGVQILNFQQQHKSVHTWENWDMYVCQDLRLEENENVDT